jgi:hypothetical protein
MNTYSQPYRGPYTRLWGGLRLDQVSYCITREVSSLPVEVKNRTMVASDKKQHVPPSRSETQHTQTGVSCSDPPWAAKYVRWFDLHKTLSEFLAQESGDVSIL